MDECDCLEHIYWWVWVDVTVENAFMGGCTFLEYIYGWVWMFVTVKGTFMGGRILKKTIMDGCDCLEHIYE